MIHPTNAAAATAVTSLDSDLRVSNLAKCIENYTLLLCLHTLPTTAAIALCHHDHPPSRVASHISCCNTPTTAARRSKNTTQVFANDPPSTTLALASKYRTRCVRDETFVNPKTFTTVLPPGVNVANGGVTPRTSRIGSRSDDEGGERAASPEREYPKPWLVGSVPASPEKQSLSLGGTMSGEGGRPSRSSNASAGGEGNVAPAVLPLLSRC